MVKPTIWGSWREIYDGKIRRLDIDLSKLKGETVRFLLRVERNGKDVSDANGSGLFLVYNMLLRQLQHQLYPLRRQQHPR